MESTARSQIHLAKEKIQTGISKKVHHWWGAFMLRGVLAIVLGIAALFSPQGTMGLLTKLLGAYFILDTVTGIFSLWKSDGQHETPVLVQTLLNLCLGVALLVFTEMSARIFLNIAGLWMFLQGGSFFLESRKRDDEARLLFSLLGGVTAAFGLTFLLWKSTSVATISYLIGISLLIVGSLLLYIAKRLKLIKHKVDTFI